MDKKERLKTILISEKLNIQVKEYLENNYEHETFSSLVRRLLKEKLCISNKKT